MPPRQQSDAVRTYQRAAVFLAGIQYLLLESGAFSRLLAEACRDDDERPDLLLGGQHLHIVGTEAGGNYQDGQVGGRQLADIVEHLDALHLVLLGIDHPERALVASAQQVADHGAARFMYIITTADDDDTFRL